MNDLAKIGKRQEKAARTHVTTYWELQLASAKKTLEGVKRFLACEPGNPWYKTWAEDVEARVAECERKIREAQA